MLPKVLIHGNLVDNSTRCQHYNSTLDIIAIKFKCCNKYYACIHCHNEAETHSTQLWPQLEWNTKAIFCGECKIEISINNYFTSKYICPNCKSNFNPLCSNHNHLYFEVNDV